MIVFSDSGSRQFVIPEGRLRVAHPRFGDDNLGFRFGAFAFGLSTRFICRPCDVAVLCRLPRKWKVGTVLNWNVAPRMGHDLDHINYLDHTDYLDHIDHTDHIDYLQWIL